MGLLLVNREHPCRKTDNSQVIGPHIGGLTYSRGRPQLSDKRLTDGGATRKNRAPDAAPRRRATKAGGLVPDLPLAD